MCVYNISQWEKRGDLVPCSSGTLLTSHPSNFTATALERKKNERKKFFCRKTGREREMEREKTTLKRKRGWVSLLLRKERSKQRAFYVVIRYLLSWLYTKDMYTCLYYTYIHSYSSQREASKKLSWYFFFLFCIVIVIIIIIIFHPHLFLFWWISSQQ